jgi:hypothetical protein
VLLQQLKLLFLLLLLLLLRRPMLLLRVVSADVNGSLGKTCTNVDNSNGTCYDVPAPGTGYKCRCVDNYVWDGTKCDVSMSRIGSPRFLRAVSVDVAGNIICTRLIGKPHGCLHHSESQEAASCSKAALKDLALAADVVVT